MRHPKYASAPFPVLAVLTLAALLSLSAGAATAADQGQSYDRDRRDIVTGTMDEGMTFGRDPESGDTVMRVEPLPKPQQQPEMYMQAPVVVPEVRYKQRSRGGVVVVPGQQQ